MSTDGSIDWFFGDAMQKFRMGIGEFRELQEKINGRRHAVGFPVIGPKTLGALLRENDAWPDDVRDILRIGLVGAGMKPADAHRMLVLHFDQSPPAENYLIAYMVLISAFVGVPEDVKKKKTPKKRKTKATNPSTSPEYTATAQ